MKEAKVKKNENIRRKNNINRREAGKKKQKKEAIMK
jgi:hypothetical protein